MDQSDLLFATMTLKNMILIFSTFHRNAAIL